MHQQQQERTEPCSRAGPVTPPTTPNNNGLIDGADKRLAQCTPHTCAHLNTQNTYLIPASAPGSCSLSDFVLLVFFPLRWSTCSESKMPGSTGNDNWKGEIKSDVGRRQGEERGVCMITGLHVLWAALNMHSGISGGNLRPTRNSFLLFHHFPELSQCLELWASIPLPSEVTAWHFDTSWTFAC